MFFLSPICCVCFQIETDLRSLNDMDSDDITLIEKFKYCTFGLNKLNHEIPLFICSSCCWSLHAAYRFKKTCVENIENLKNYVALLKKTNFSTDSSSSPNGIYCIGNLNGQPVNFFAPITAFSDRNVFSNIQVKIDKHSQDLGFTKIEKIRSSVNLLEPHQIKQEPEDFSCKIKHFDRQIYVIEDSEDENHVSSDEDASGQNFTNDCNDESNDSEYSKKEHDRKFTSKELEKMPVQFDVLDIEEINQRSVVNSVKKSTNSRASEEENLPSTSGRNNTETSDRSEVSSTKSNLEDSDYEASNKSFSNDESLDEDDDEEEEEDEVANSDDSEWRSRPKRGRKPKVIQDLDKRKPGRPAKVKEQLIKRKRGRPPKIKKPNSCPYCNKSFVRNVNMLSHLVIHLNWSPLLCPFCNKKFVKKTVLRHHIKSHSNQELLHKCDMCNNRFAKKQFLVEHLQNHLERPFSCSICGRCFTDETKLNFHVSLHEKETPHQCDRCGQRFKKEWALNRHLYARNRQRCCYNKTKMEQKLFKYSCDICKLSFNSEAELNSHNTMEHGALHQCSKCGKSFANSSSLRIHLKTHEEQKLFTCTICFESLETSHRLQVHRRIKHKTGEPKSVCPTCGKTFNKKSLLSDHMSSHSTDYSHVCKYCGRKYKVLSKFKRHVLKHDPEKTHWCKICGSKFIQLSVYQNHMLTHLKNKTTKKCMYCPFTYTMYSSMYKHMKRYHKTALHSCLTCGKDFMEKASLNNHIFLTNHTAKEQKISEHNGDTPFSKTEQCNYCDKVYKLRDSLVRHMRFYHPSKLFGCATCGKYYMEEKSLKCHLKESNHTARAQETNGDAPYLLNPNDLKSENCPYCDKSYVWRESLNQHIRAHHRSKMVSCGTCEKYFKDKNSLETHLRQTNHEAKQSEADDDSNQQMETNVDDQMSNDDKPEKCLQCDSTYMWKDSLHRHIRKRHNSSLYSCKTCDKSFKEKSDLDMHIQEINHKAHVSDTSDTDWEQESNGVPTEENESEITKEEHGFDAFEVDEENIPSALDFVAKIQKVEGQDEIYILEDAMNMCNEVEVETVKYTERTLNILDAL